jgi:hypothetical protein
MGTNKNIVVSFSIAILLLLSLLLLLTYNSKCNNSQNNKMMTNSYNVQDYSSGPEPFYFEKFSNDEQKGTSEMKNEVTTNWSPQLSNQYFGDQSNQPTGPLNPSGSTNGDSSFLNVSLSGSGSSSGSSSVGGNNANAFGSSNNANKVEQDISSCFPRDRLTADDLLPKDAADSKWARINPSGGGNISDQNFLTAGYHVGVNTVGQSRRNANLQLRSELPNPQNAVGPWMISTIEPDLRQNTLEIGSSVAY